MPVERRASARESVALSVLLADGRRATTRNISTGGLYLVVHDPGPLDPWVSFEFAVPSARLKFRAAAEVLRIEPQPGGGTGYALKLHGGRLEPLN